MCCFVNLFIAKKLGATCVTTDKEFEEEDSYGLVKTSILLSWVELKHNTSAGIALLENLIKTTTNTQDLPVSLAYSFLALHYLETGNLSEALNIIKQAETSQAADDNIIGVAALCSLALPGTDNADKLKLAKSVFLQTNPIIHKRLLKQVINKHQ